MLVPTLEVIAYLSHVGLLQRCYDAVCLAGTDATSSDRGNGHHTNLKQLCLLVQKAAYKTGNVRKLEACIKVYGAIASLKLGIPATYKSNAGNTNDGTSTQGGNTDNAGPVDVAKITDPERAGREKQHEEGVTEAKKRLGALLAHPWPRVRSMVVDELWGLVGLGLELSGDGDDGRDGDGRQEINNEGRGYDGGYDEEMEKEKKSNLLLGTDWGKADKSYVKRIVGEIGLE